MIVDQYRVIMVHIPKCAGTSIETTYGDMRGHHGSWCDYGKDFPQAWKDYFKFSVCRHPYGYVVSLYNYWMNTSKSTWFPLLDNNVAAKETSETRFRSKIRDFDDMLDKLDYLKCADWTRTHFRTQSSFVCDQETSKLMVDYMVRMEDFSAGMSYVQGRIGAPCVRIPKINHIPSKMTVSDLTFSQKCRIAEFYKVDFSTFGYHP